VLVLLVSGCITNRIAPGVLREDWREPRRDPDPTANPTEQQTGNPWASEEEARIGPPSTAEEGEEEESSAPSADDGHTVEIAKRGAATFFAWAAGGWIPLVEWSGTFEEDPEQRDRLKKKAQ
jgi:hypothetical protein